MSYRNLIVGKKSKKTTLILSVTKPNATLLKLENVDFFIENPSEDDYEMIDKYRTIIFWQPKGIAIKSFFKYLDIRDEKRLLKKIRVVTEDATRFKNINEFVDSLNYSDRTIKRELLKQIKGNAKVTAYDLRLKEKQEVLDSLGSLAIQSGNLNNLRKVISQKSLLNIDYTNEAFALISRNNQSSKAINFEIKGKYLNEIKSDLEPIIKRNKRILISAPTGTGKSWFVKNTLTKMFKRVLILSPFSLVTNELGDADNITLIDNQFKPYQAIRELENTRYASITTDKLYNLIESDEFGEDARFAVSLYDCIVFDEQHIINQSKNFRGKVVKTAKLIDTFDNNKIFLSGTPIFRDLPNYKHIVVKVAQKAEMSYYEDNFKDEEEILNKIREVLKTSNTLIYTSTVRRAEEVYRYIRANKIKAVMVTSRGNLYEGKYISNEELYSLRNVCIVGTSRITTGVNIPTLNTIFQIGTPYNSDTFIQLVARIRGNGEFYNIKTFSGNDRYSSVTNKALHILNRVVEYQTITSKGLIEAVDINRIDWGDRKDYHKQFLSIYRNALALIASKNMGAWNVDKTLFTFNLNNIKNLDTAFEDTETVNFNKYIDRLAIGVVQKNGRVEELNNIYNLSFDFKYYPAVEEVEYKRLITDADLEQRREDSKSDKERQEEIEESILTKLKNVLTTENEIKRFKKEFTYSEMLQLDSDERLEKPEIIKAINQATHDGGVKIIEKIARLKFFLIDKAKIVDIAIQGLKKKPYLTISDLSDMIEVDGRLTSRKSKTPFYFFIRDIFKMEVLNQKGLYIGFYDKVIDGKRERKRNVLMLSDKARKQLAENELLYRGLVQQAIKGKEVYQNIPITILDEATETSVSVLNREVTNTTIKDKELKEHVLQASIDTYRDIPITIIDESGGGIKYYNGEEI